MNEPGLAVRHPRVGVLADWREDIRGAEEVERWMKHDPIDVARAGPLIPDAIALMLEVGWK